MKDQSDNNFVDGIHCPLPLAQNKKILLAHGSGGLLTQQLINDVFLPKFGNELLQVLHDGAALSIKGTRLAFSTDTYVVHPIFFPGGNIGDLAINGTINDLAMCGAHPLYLSSAFIIEEGLPISDLERVVSSMQIASTSAGVTIVTGDTKVVDRGKGDHLFITTSGIGIIPDDITITPQRAAVGDSIILSGSIGEHGIAIMSVREHLEFESPICSDTAALHTLVEAMLNKYRDIHVLRDPTRGGVATVLNEIATQARVGIAIDERLIPISEGVQSACEILGIDPLYVANEGKLIAFVSANETDQILQAMRCHPLGKQSVVIGKVVSEHPGTVVMRNSIGTQRILSMLSGEQLPRIC